MLAKERKTGMFLFNCKENEFDLPSINGDICRITKINKVPGVKIDNTANYREHVSRQEKIPPLRTPLRSTFRQILA